MLGSIRNSHADSAAAVVRVSPSWRPARRWRGARRRTIANSAVPINGYPASQKTSGSPTSGEVPVSSYPW